MNRSMRKLKVVWLSGMEWFTMISKTSHALIVSTADFCNNVVPYALDLNCILLNRSDPVYEIASEGLTVNSLLRLYMFVFLIFHESHELKAHLQPRATSETVQSPPTLTTGRNEPATISTNQTAQTVDMSTLSNLERSKIV